MSEPCRLRWGEGYGACDDALPERLPLSRQKEFKRIKNIVIEEAARLGREGTGGGYTQATLNRVNVPQGASPLTSATRLLHHMSRIFQEQAPPSTGGISFVDSKLRRKIREKKIAMGHKPDDHEDQPVMTY